MMNVSWRAWRDAWLEIDLGNLVHNLQQIRRYLSSDCQFMAVVKADAYGHGAVKVVETLIQEGIRHFGVATFEEGMELRVLDRDCEILILGALPLAVLPAAIAADLSCTVFNYDQIAVCRKIAQAGLYRPKVHIKLDTGMHRLGVNPDCAVEFIKYVQSCPEVELRGIFTHLACAEDEMCSQQQIVRWEEIISRIDNRDLLLHLANSAATLSYRDKYSNLCRLGLILYGLYPDMPSTWSVNLSLKSLITLKSKIVDVHVLAAGEGVGYGYRYHTSRPSVVATIPLGYADGIPRALSGQLIVRVNGKLVKQVGSIAMDQMMIDVTDCDARLGDTVTLLDDELTVDSWAALANTISYEILCALRARLPKFYHHSAHDRTL